MTSQKKDRPATRRRRGGLFVRLGRSRDGVAAIEFALLAIPFFLLLFAIIETCIAYAAEQVLDNAVDEMARKLRTGQITYETGQPTDMTKGEFRAAFCEQIAILMSCDDKLSLNVQSLPSFNQIPEGIPREDGRPFGDLDTSGFDYAPGQDGSKNIVRAYYRWPIVTDLIRPFVTNIRPEDGSMPSDYLIVGTAVVQNEEY